MARDAPGARDQHRWHAVGHPGELAYGGERRADRQRGLGPRRAQHLEPGQVVHDGPNHRSADALRAAGYKCLACEGLNGIC